MTTAMHEVANIDDAVVPKNYWNNQVVYPYRPRSGKMLYRQQARSSKQMDEW